MTITELVASLESFRATHGDLEVYTNTCIYEENFPEPAGPPILRQIRRRGGWSGSTSYQNDIIWHDEHPDIRPNTPAPRDVALI